MTKNVRRSILTVTRSNEPGPQEPAPYLVKLAARRKAMKNYWRYIEHCKRVYPGGSLSK